ncbi:pyridoxamine 5'-phosphate oxidase family protein [Nocardioides dilutus]
MPEIHELDPPTCQRLLRRGVFGRFAFVSPRGPEIFPVNYVVHGEAVVVRTGQDSALARHGAGADLVFEVDAVDHEYWSGFSVIARGVGEILDSPPTAQVGAPPPRPWAGGDRDCVLQMPWTELSGRAIGRRGSLDAMLAVGRTL